MQEQNLEEWKEKIDRSAEQITVPDTLTPGAVQQMLEERKNRTSAGRKEHRHYRRFAGIAAAVAVLVIAVGTYGWNKYGTDDAQPKKAALSVTETVDSTQDTEKKEQIGAFTLAKSYQDVYAAVQKKSNSQKELAEGTVDDLFFVEDTGSAEAKKESSGTHSDTNLQVNGVDEGDIVKNDGNYLYVLNDDRVTIVDIRDKNMRKLSEIRPELTENSRTTSRRNLHPRHIQLSPVHKRFCAHHAKIPHVKYFHHSTSPPLYIEYLVCPYKTYGPPLDDPCFLHPPG